MSRYQTKHMDAEDFAYRLQWLAGAGIQLTVEKSQCEDEWHHAAPSVQALFETLEGLAADLCERLDEIGNARAAV